MAFLITMLLNLIQVYWFILIVYALLSWFPGAYQTGLGRLLIWLVEPVLSPFRRLRLQFMGIDFTILLVVILLEFLSNFLRGLF